ncbi:MAG: pyridoxal-phosphate dependent enzyme [Vicinamibacterales bacterium]
MTSRVFANPLRATGGAGPRVSRAELDAVAAFAPHRPATPLHDARAIADALGLAALLVKDETHRWGLNAFKITGVSYALDTWSRTSDLNNSPGAITCASAGNHGRAVARAARERGLPCRVFLPADALPARVHAIRGEGADVVQIDGSYEDAIDRAAAYAAESGALLVSDTAPPGDPEITQLIMRGYTKVLSEAAAAWNQPPDVIVVQGGVGGLVGAAAAWIRSMLPSATLIAAEPEGSACLKASAAAGRLSILPATAATSMVCLRCAAPSAVAWPFIAAGVDGFVTVTDAEAASAVSMLAGAGIDSGASGACGLAALAAIAPELRGRGAMIIVTEGP